MKKVYQKYLHIPIKRQKGDCWRACLASILECDIELFPNPNEIKDWPTLYSKTVEVIYSLGYEYSSRPVSLFHENGYCIAIGKSPRSKTKRISHAVVWNNGIVHDPHPDKTGLLDITRFEFLTKYTY
jgi:hypothetical protein